MDDLELEPDLAAPEPPIDEVAQAQAARETAALRGARGQLRRTPVAMTEMAPAKVASDEDYAALLPGSFFVGPDAIKRRKPWYVTDDASYDAVPEGEEFLDPAGVKRQKPKYEDLPYTVQTLYNMAVNDKERLKILEQAYPGRVKTTPRGELYVEEEGGTRRKGKGFTQAPGAFLSAEAAPALTATLGEIGGAAAGFLGGGPVGAAVGGIAGGGAGGAAGQGFNDIILSIAGVYDRTGEEAAWQYGKQGLLGAAGSALGRVAIPAGKSVYEWGKQMAPAAVAKFLGAEKEPLEMALSLRGKDVLTPISGWAFNAPHLHNLSEILDPAFRTKGGGPYQESATRYFEKDSERILRSMGLDAPESVIRPTAAVPTEEAGKALQARAQGQAMENLARTDAELADRVAQARATAMAEDVLSGNTEVAQALEANRRAAQSLIDDGFRTIQASVDDAMRAANADVNSGDLWRQVATRLQELRRAMMARYRTWYQQADDVAGDVSLDLGDLPQAADFFLKTLPEGFEKRYPDIIRQITKLADSDTTWGQLHNLRNQIRHDVDWFSLSRSIDDGVNIHFNNEINAVLHNPDATGRLGVASQMLDAIDRSYGANMAIWNDQRLNAVTKGLRSGQPADPSELFNTVVREGRSDLTNWVRQQVGPNLWAGVRAADVQEMLDFSRSLAPGQIDGMKFVEEVLKRHRHNMLEAVHGPQAQQLLSQAQAIAALRGKIDIPARPGDTLSEIIARIRQMEQAQRAAGGASPMDTIEQEARRLAIEHRRAMSQARQSDPLSFLNNPSVGAIEAVDRILAKEDTVIAAAMRFGEHSPEFEMLRRVYAERFLRKSMDPAQHLGEISPEVQKLMFPGITGEQMQLLAREMEFLLGTKAARTEAGRSIMATAAVEHPKGKLPAGAKLVTYLGAIPGIGTAARAALGEYLALVTKLGNSPTIMRFILKGLQGSEAEKVTVRNLMRAMLYGKGASRGGAVGAGTLAGTGALPTGAGREDVDPALSGAQQNPQGFWQLPEGR